MGPAASQIAIKQLGTNGGGFFNVNSAHPFENPTPLVNFLQMLSILLIAAALCYTFGVMVGDTRQGWAVLAAMTLVFVGLLALCAWRRWAWIPRRATCIRAAIWRVRRSALALSTLRSGRQRRLQPRTARSTRCTIRLHPWVGWYRCS